ncbi:MAG: hypothetical protein D6B27_09605 [Gammaproteobacteria bacterium]|nr:MAG: hypothetical protein D6B27_09605 [Gammaproteobacteria bacterium]
MTKESSAVIGLGFGDEGKGRTTSYIASKKENAIVIRFSGGQQAAHHVITQDGLDHVFSNFGSATLQKIPTYWSSFCTFDPEGAMNEYMVLEDKGVIPHLFVDAKCPVTTPYEKMANMNSEQKKENGTVGVGVGSTWEREKNLLSLLVEDLQNPTVLKIKMGLIEKYYNLKIDTESFFHAVEDMKNVITMVQGSLSILNNYNQYIFEGSQGLLLDQEYGFFPHVTRSSVGLKNISKINPIEKLNVFYVTRAYQTRHGNGPMTNHGNPVRMNPYEQICPGPQGDFRTAILDLDLLLYSINKDSRYFDPVNYTKNLVITCLDVLEDNQLTYHQKLYRFPDKMEFIKFISDKLGFFNSVYYSESPVIEDMRLFE